MSSRALSSASEREVLIVANRMCRPTRTPAHKSLSVGALGYDEPKPQTATRAQRTSIICRARALKARLTYIAQRVCTRKKTLSSHASWCARWKRTASPAAIGAIGVLSNRGASASQSYVWLNFGLSRFQGPLSTKRAAVFLRLWIYPSVKHLFIASLFKHNVKDTPNPYNDVSSRRRQFYLPRPSRTALFVVPATYPRLVIFAGGRCIGRLS